MAFAYEAPIVSLVSNKDLLPAFLVSISLAKMLQTQREDMLSLRSTLARGQCRNILLAQLLVTAKVQTNQMVTFLFEGV
jgi:hypothetical protein